MEPSRNPISRHAPSPTGATACGCRSCFWHTLSEPLTLSFPFLLKNLFLLFPSCPLPSPLPPLAVSMLTSISLFFPLSYYPCYATTVHFSVFFFFHSGFASSLCMLDHGLTPCRTFSWPYLLPSFCVSFLCLRPLCLDYLLAFISRCVLLC